MVSPKRWGCLWSATLRRNHQSRRKGMKRLGTTRIMMKDFRFNHSIIPISVVSLLRFIFFGFRTAWQKTGFIAQRPTRVEVFTGAIRQEIPRYVRVNPRCESFRLGYHVGLMKGLMKHHLWLWYIHITSYYIMMESFHIYIYVYIYKWYHFLLESFHFGYAVDPSFLSHEIMISVIPRVRPGDPSPTCLRQSGRRRARLNLRISNQAVYRSVYMRFIWDLYEIMGYSWNM